MSSNCKFFAAGTCRWGDKCKFVHENSPSATQQPPSTTTTSTTTACKFFASGNCRHGDSCQFSHSRDAAPAVPPVGYISPMLINLPPGTPIFSIDVECAATSPGHNSRAVCAIGMVDEFCNPMENLLVREDPEKPVMSYLWNITGITRSDVEANGLSFQEALDRIKSRLNPESFIVGQNILKDVQWLGLKEGIDYKHLIDLNSVFRVWNMQRNSWTNFSQDHVARVWLNVGERETHNALEDASIAMSLFNAYRTIQWEPPRLQYMQMETLHAPRVVSYAAQNGSIEGCCLGHKKTCTCGEPFFIS